jgi:anti-anti-sigma factor
VAEVTIRVAADGSVVTIVVRGNLDANAVGGLSRVLAGAIVRERPRRLVVDLSHVTSIDGTGIGTLVAAGDAARDVDVELSLHRPSPVLARHLPPAG